ncbi:MAG: acyl dehydratase [Dehalococcoidia bacterium]|nr:acyl dehydratase [Dehalococcoidia bacterium]
MAAVAEGALLSAVERQISQEQIGRYADAVGDHNPIHIDPTFAAATPFGGTIAHGMLALALISESLTATFGARWGERSRLKIRFRAPARPGDLLRACGQVRRIREDAGGRYAECSVECRNRSGEVLINGEARVPLDG